MAKHKNRQSEKQNILGTKIQYVGILGTKFICAACGRESKRAMVSEYKGKLYCDDHCISLSQKEMTA